MTIENREKIGIGAWERDRLGGTANDLDRAGFAWHYTWCEWKPWDGDATSELSSFVPMAWNELDLTPEALNMMKGSGATTMLGFNEPDYKTQANMSVARALELWPQLETTGLRLGSPAPTQGQVLGANSWLAQFMAGAEAKALKVDFVAVHYYSANKDVGAFKAFLEAVHKQYDKPVWVTEWALADWSNPGRFSAAEQAAFAQAGTEMMDDLSFVEKHAWFAAYEGGDGWHLGSGIFDAAGNLTEVGRAFADLNALTPTIMGSTGADTLAGGAKSEALHGLDGADRLLGGGGYDTLKGGAGNDTLDGGAGVDRLEGGAGNDTYVIADAGDVVIELLGEGVDTVHAWLGHALATEVENLRLNGAGNLVGTGNALDNRIIGNAGHNTLDGRGGRDRLEGGAGNDTYIVDNAGDVVVELAGQGSDVVLASASFALGAGGVNKLTLTGTSAISGTGNVGANTIWGNAASNSLSGRGGNDWLNGASGNDSLDGGDGHDTLDGGAGADRLRGGSGADTFVFASGQDRVVDFADNVDTLRINDALWGGTTKSVAEVLSFASFLNGAVLFDFRNGHTLEVAGITSIGALGDDLVIV